MSIEDFLSNDDIVTGYHINRWKYEDNKTLSELCNRFHNRNLFKAIDINKINFENQLKALSIAQSITRKKGKDPYTSCGIKKKKLHGYSPYIGGLRVWDGVNLEALEHRSDLISSLIRPSESTWLIYDKEIHEELQKEISLLNLRK
tara:strand:- start:71 stop:508 length:438 start_codon:yes stop_codon:yes gene_type:complete